MNPFTHEFSLKTTDLYIPNTVVVPIKLFHYSQMFQPYFLENMCSLFCGTVPHSLYCAMHHKVPLPGRKPATLWKMNMLPGVWMLLPVLRIRT
jgi:hypothetical protein